MIISGQKSQADHDLKKLESILKIMFPDSVIIASSPELYSKLDNSYKIVLEAKGEKILYQTPRLLNELGGQWEVSEHENELWAIWNIDDKPLTNFNFATWANIEVYPF